MKAGDIKITFIAVLLSGFIGHSLHLIFRVLLRLSLKRCKSSKEHVKKINVLERQFADIKVAR